MTFLSFQLNCVPFVDLENFGLELTEDVSNEDNDRDDSDNADKDLVDEEGTNTDIDLTNDSCDDEQDKEESAYSHSIFLQNKVGTSKNENNNAVLSDNPKNTLKIVDKDPPQENKHKGPHTDTRSITADEQSMPCNRNHKSGDTKNSKRIMVRNAKRFPRRQWTNGTTFEYHCLERNCKKIFPSKASAYKHVNLVHYKAALLKRYNEMLPRTEILPKYVSRERKCKLCDMAVNGGQSSSLILHLHIQHKLWDKDAIDSKVTKSVSVTPARCQFCQKDFAYERALQCHLATTHYHNVMLEAHDRMATNADSKLLKFQCKFCQKKMCGREAFLIHLGLTHKMLQQCDVPKRK